MNLYEYISAYRMNPNPAVAKSLGADERLVEYLKETPWNTSVNVVRGMCEGGESKPVKEAWFTIDGWTEVDGFYAAVLTPTELFTQEKEQDFLNRYFLYNVMADNTKLNLVQEVGSTIVYADINSIEEAQNMTIYCGYDGSQWICASSIPNNPTTTIYFEAPPTRDYSKWTTIRFNQMQVEGHSEYYYGTTNSEDVNKIRELIALYKTNQHPIIQGAYSIHYTIRENDDYIIESINSNNGIGTRLIDDEYDGVVIDFVEGALRNGAFRMFIYSTEQYPNDYIEIKYKIDTYYTITINTGESRSDIFYVEPNFIWDTTTYFNLMDNKGGIYLTDGTHNWHKGDTITFTSDMTLTLVEE